MAAEPDELEVLHPEASVELREAVLWHREHSSDAVAFVVEVNRVIENLMATPLRWPVLRNVTPSTHYRVMTSYPYTLFYRPAGGGILVLAVAHHSREPLYWTHRH